LEIGNAKPIKQVKSKSRFLCLAINYLRPEIAKKKKKSEKKIKKQIGKRKKLSKDERMLLKR
jgi:hypothetical protein